MFSAIDAKDSGFCPVCERYIGPVLVCTYCNSDTMHKQHLLWLRSASLAFAIIGLCGLGLMSYFSQYKRIDVVEIRPRMNSARIRISGTSNRRPYVSKDKSGKATYVSIPLYDGTGIINITAYNDIADHLVSARKLPGKGQQVHVFGTLDIRAGRIPRLNLRNTDHMIVAEAEN